MLWNLPYMLWNLHRNSTFTRKNGPRGLKFFRCSHLTKLRNPNIILTIQFPGGGVIYHTPGLTLPKSFFLLHKLIVKTPTQPQLNLTSTKVLGLTKFQAASNPTHKPLYLITYIPFFKKNWFAAFLFKSP